MGERKQTQPENKLKKYWERFPINWRKGTRVQAPPCMDH